MHMHACTHTHACAWEHLGVDLNDPDVCDNSQILRISVNPPKIRYQGNFLGSIPENTKGSHSLRRSEKVGFPASKKKSLKNTKFGTWKMGKN